MEHIQQLIQSLYLELEKGARPLQGTASQAAPEGVMGSRWICQRGDHRGLRVWCQIKADH